MKPGISQGKKDVSPN